jgi:hypothetical protein
LESARRYPFAIAGLNLTMLLFGILGWGMRVSTGKATVAAGTRTQVQDLIFGDNTNQALLQQLARRQAALRPSASAPNLHTCPSSPSAPSSNNSATTSASQSSVAARRKLLLDFGDEPTSATTDASSEAYVADDEVQDILESSDIDQVQAEPRDEFDTSGTDQSLEVLGQHDHNQPSHRRFAFDELYCLLFRVFDAEWYRARASYMQFPSILEATQMRFEAMVGRAPFDLDAIVRMNDEAEMNATHRH